MLICQRKEAYLMPARITGAGIFVPKNSRKTPIKKQQNNKRINNGLTKRYFKTRPVTSLW
jgi:hypothetical protein